MEKHILGKTGYEITPVTYGGIVSMRDGQTLSDHHVAWAIERGINYFDVAPTYDDAQEKLGRSLEPYRKSVYLACKTMQRLQKEAELEFNESLRLLHTDYLDNYQLHGLSGVDEVEKAFSSGGVMDFVVRLKAQGHVRKLGITCHNEDAAVRAMELYDFDTLMFPLNWHMMIGHGFGSRALKMAREKGIGVIAIKALIERAWQDGDADAKARFPKSWCKPIDPDNLALRLAAVKYTLSLGADTLIPPGDFDNFAFIVEHVDECLKYPLNEQDLAFLRAEYEKVKDYPFFKV